MNLRNAVPVWLTKFLLIAGMMMLLVLSVQPWIIVTGPFFNRSIVAVPLVRPLIDGIASIWFVGKPIAGLLLILMREGEGVGALLLCALANLSQVAEMVLRVRGIESGAIAATSGNGTPQPKSLESRAIAFLALLGRVRACGYVAELLVCFTAYAPYGKGFGALVADWPTLDPSLWNWLDIGRSLLNMFGFEMVIATVLGIWSGIGVMQLLVRTTSQPIAQGRRANAQ
jgi:hypothetical protein